MHALTRSRTMLAGALLLTTALVGCSASTPDAGQSAAPSSADQQEPSAQPQVESEQVQLAQGHFAIALPQGWQMREIENEYYQYNQDSAASVEFLNPAGELMATLRTGAESLAEDAMPSTPEENVLIDGATLDATEGPHLSFIAAAANPDSALIALTEVSPDQQADYQPVSASFNYQGGSASFQRQIEPDDQLTDVDPGLHGTKRMRAYLETEEYKQLKTLMMSFEQLKEITGQPPQEPTSTPEG